MDWYVASLKLQKDCRLLRSSHFRACLADGECLQDRADCTSICLDNLPLLLGFQVTGFQVTVVSGDSGFR